jgi:hypothetical protein
MTISFEELKARLLANPKVKAEYDALAPEFEISAELLKARLRAGLSQVRTGCSDGDQPVHHCPTGERPDAAEHQDTVALRPGDRQQVPRAAVGCLMRYSRTAGNDIVQNRTVARRSE